MLLRVDWIDVVEDYDLRPDAEIAPAKCVSFGFFDTLTDDALVIAREKRGNDFDKQAIPLGCIKSVTVLTCGPDIPVENLEILCKGGGAAPPSLLAEGEHVTWSVGEASRSSATVSSPQSHQLSTSKPPT